MFSPLFKQLIVEATKPTKTKTANPWADEIPSADDDVHLPSAYTEPKQQDRKKVQTRRSLGTTASARQTAAKAADVLNDPRAGSFLNDLMRSDLNTPGVEDEPTTDVSTEVLTPEDLPATISSSMTRSGEVVPEWHMVKNLPGYMQQAIRRLGASVFSQYTRTPIEKIQVLANLQGNGPNSSRELNAIAKWAVENGEKVTVGDIDFSVMPGYKADVAVYNVEGSQLLLVRDDFGQYVYAWPEADSTVGDWTAEKRLK